MKLRRIRSERGIGIVYRFACGGAENVLKVICLPWHTCSVPWLVEILPEFEAELNAQPSAVMAEAYSRASLLEQFGPQLGRPLADTLNGSVYPNMKELRFTAGGGVWRLAFAFDPARQAILLVMGDKRGANQARFYRDLIRKADERFAKYLEKTDQA